MPSRSAPLRRRISLTTAWLLMFQIVGIAIAPAALAAPPTISSFTPTSGPVGTSVTINGTNFTGANRVEFNGAQSTFTVNQAGTVITATVPTGATTGPITVNVPSEGSTTTSTNFFVTTANPPTITSFTPTSGAPGTTVTINGTDLQGATAVRFGGVNATSFTVVSPIRITAVVPTTAGTGAIQVITPQGTATSSSSFVVTPAGPTITSFTPTSGSAGTSVTINGTNFTGATSVTFNGVAATFTVNTSTRITATVPTTATTGPIRVTTPNGTATSATNFTVTQGAPVISSFAPANGPIGSTVVLTGSSFTGTITVRFDGVNAPFTVNSNTQITATVPTGADTGRITVTNGTGTGTSQTDFIVTRTPTITSFTPASGAPGTSVTINGTNFTAISSVAFSGVSAQFTVNSSTRITATVPAGATTGRITVSNSAGTATSATDFTTAPGVTSFSPASGLPGTSVVITGTTFTGATAVTFNGVASTFVVNSATQITATVPAGATTGRIAVTGPTGTGTSSTDFVIIQIHERHLSFRLRGHLIADGVLTATDGFAGCVSGVTIFIQMKISGNWNPLKTATTAANGTWATRIPDRRGRYRAIVLRSETATDVCRAAGSRYRIHRHL